MSMRQRWKTLSPAAQNRIVAAQLDQLQRRPRYTARQMERRQIAIYALVAPDLWPDEIARMREFLGPALDRRSATRVWALRHQRNLVEILKASPMPALPA